MGKIEKLNVAEIFKSIHGELPYQGKPVCIIRLAGCESGCTYCDAKKYQKMGSGQDLALDKIFHLVKKTGLMEVLVTGGEPLLQKSTISLLKMLVDKGYSTTLETDGSYDISRVPKKVTVVMDIKTHRSGAKRKTIFSNVSRLKQNDILKIVVEDIKDYNWAKRTLKRLKSKIKCQVAFSPVFGSMSVRKLAEALIRDNSKHRVQLQLHKILGLK